jgi:hypothetical protein
MSRRKPIDAKILEASKKFNAEIFAETVRGAFADLPDYRRNQSRVLYPVWYLSLVVLCGFFCGCNTIEESADYADLQEDWFSSLLGERSDYLRGCAFYCARISRTFSLLFALRWKIFSIKRMPLNGMNFRIHFIGK